VIDEHWVQRGPSDEQSRGSALPEYVEVAPEVFEPVDECSSDELRAEADSCMVQATASMNEAAALYDLSKQ
jgi:hypothetical protein